MADDLTASSFSQHEGTTFTVHVGDATVELELVDVTEHEYDSIEGFSVLFLGADEQVFEHGTYQVQHDELGSLDLSLGPVVTGNEKQGDQHFEAVYTRRK